MKSHLLIAMLAASLSACQTTKPIVPIALQQANGGGVLQLCLGDGAGAKNFTVNLERATSDLESVEQGNAAFRLTKTLRLEDTQNAFRRGLLAHGRRDCLVWQFEGPPGQYAITSIGERWSTRTGGTVPVGNPAAVLLGAVFATAFVASSNNDEITFVTENKSLTEETPTLELKRGQVTHFGTITFLGQSTMQEQPKLESDGSWDGESMDSALVNRYVLRYTAAGTQPDKTKAVEGAYLSGLRRQQITALVGREYVVEDYPEVVFPNQ